MNSLKLDASDPGKAAEIFALGAILFAKVSGMNAENMSRESCGERMAYHQEAYEIAIQEFYDEVPGKQVGPGNVVTPLTK